MHRLCQTNLTSARAARRFHDALEDEVTQPTTTSTDPTTSIPIPKIQNVVSSVNLDTIIDLYELALRANNTEYNPKRFHAVVMRMRSPRSTANIFSSGKMIVTGTNSLATSRLATLKFARMVEKAGFNARFEDYAVENIVASCNVGFGVNLDALARTHALICVYESEIFPGLVYHVFEPKVTVMLFGNGKVVLTGSKIHESLLRAFELVYPVLVEFMRD
ncbi:eukaryotic TATA box binding transcription initiation factor TFIID-1 [Piedraia hortae CBS 480.64]|uniref:Eukaryotic TATA box binding transcription initiation factor TFIID-1 n=1 Tax=Piedraia hortae CBS 480.64 TaxID=1314780 RepID=A0A6A7BZQ4_9PEZI|nr:eukaryotic TATA box binding transcription initiation factor TFIID-1 [Piedraia hortae CBS 480.64]